MNEEQLGKLWQRAKRHAESRGYIRDAEDFAQEFVMRYLKNNKCNLGFCFIDYLRSNYLYKKSNSFRRSTILNYSTLHYHTDDEFSGEEIFPHKGPSPEDICAAKEQVKYLEHLNKKEKRVIALRIYEGLTHREVGERLGLTENYINIMIMRIQEKLEHLWAGSPNVKFSWSK